MFGYTRGFSFFKYKKDWVFIVAREIAQFLLHFFKLKGNIMNFKILLAVFTLFFISTISFVSCSGDVSEDDIAPGYEVFQNKSTKRGVSYGFQMPEVDTRLLAPGISWFYNWGPNISETLETYTSMYDFEFFPMAWNGSFNASQIRAYKTLHPECEYILAYNEPNLTDQANMTPRQAADIWPELKSLATELNMKIISPAMNYGTLAGYSDPIVWLDEFFNYVPLSNIDGIAVHSYMGAAGAMGGFIDRFKKYGKPIWLTEFCAWEPHINSVNAQMRYMSDALNYLECKEEVVRYAWFIPRASGSVESYPYMQLLTKTTPYELSELGKVFVNMSTQDKTIFYPEFQKIPAEHYSSLNMAESVKNGTYANSVRLRPTTDISESSDDLEVFDFYLGYWLEYQVEMTRNRDYILTLRYASAFETSCTLFIDGQQVASFDLLNTTSESNWATFSVPVDIEKGKHTIRLQVYKGALVLNWLMFDKK